MGFSFSIHKVLEATGMEHCNGLLTPKIFKAPFWTYDTVPENNRDWPNLYASVKGMMLYLASKTISGIYFSVN